MTKKIILYVLIILWMSVIFIFSAQEATQSKKVSSGVIKTVVRAVDFNNTLSDEEVDNISEKLTFIVRKGAHFSAYAFLSLLVALLLAEYKIFRIKQMLISVCIAFLYACSDEIHQLFVNGRSGEVRDVLIDTCGAVTGVLILWLIVKVKNKFKKNTN